MDQEKFGQFLTSLRKEKGWTQAELAKRLHVTDKAVSKWECGKGFPDIQTLEPLSEALNISILELLRSEKTTSGQISTETANHVIDSVLGNALYQRKMERRGTRTTIIAVLLLGMTVFLIDLTGGLGFFLACLPIILTILGTLLLMRGIWLKLRHKTYLFTFVAGLLCLVYPIAVLLFFVLAGMLGLEPVPT